MVRARILARLAWMFVTLLNRSVRVRFVNKESAERLGSQKGKLIYAFFHGDMIHLLHAYQDSGILIPASESRDGEIMAHLLKNFGFDVVRGSSKRKGHRALRELIAGMRKGKTVAISVDGPRGPAHKVKPGALFLAGLMKAPIVPLAISADRCMVFRKSWDQLMLPAPFSEVAILYGKPLYVNGTSEEEIQTAQRRLEASLRGLKHDVRTFFPGGCTAAVN
jgi:hypothetical protein